MDDAGLKAILIVIGMPFDMPPKIPPELFVFVTIFPFFTMYRSLFSEPNNLEPSNPEPNSTPLTDGIENIALLKSDSNDPKIGSPIPTGTFVVIDSIIPSFFLLFFHQDISLHFCK
jgi:hypothetical protein